MPGPFTHVYTARRVADFLASPEASREFLRKRDRALLPDQKLSEDLLAQLGPGRCSKAMTDWPKFTAVGAVGPDLFFWLQDYNIPLIKCDEIMMAMSLLYYLDNQKFLEDPFDGLVTILATAVPDSWGRILLFIVKLHKLYMDFMKIWKSTIGQIIEKAGQILDDLAGGLFSALGQALEQFKNGILALVAEELLTEADIFGWFSLKMRKGFDEQAFVWSDMTHYRRTSVLPARMIQKAQAMLEKTEDKVSVEHGEQLLAFALGWVCHVGTDVIAHSFVNEQCGGPFRTHWQRHHLIENHIDAYNYECTRTGVLEKDEFCGWTPTYESVADCALYFAVQIPQDIDKNGPTDDPTTKLGKLRQPLPDDDGTQATQDKIKELLDTDGALPLWLAETISKTFIEVYASPEEGGDASIQDKMGLKGDLHDVPHPMNLKGQTWQNYLNSDTSMISQWLALLGIKNIPTELEKLREIIAPDSATGDMKFKTPAGFPFPWEIQVAYRFMLSWFKRSFVSTFNIPCPQPPSVFVPPSSDAPDFGPPDTSGVNPDDPPLAQGCELIAAIIDWFVKQIEKTAQYIWDWVKAIASAATYPLREEIYEHITLPVWEAAESIRMVLCHLGYFMPQSYQTWPGSNDMKFPNEIDEMLIRLGHSVDSAFQHALADSYDVLGNLDRDPNLNTDGLRDVLKAPNPWLPVRLAPDGVMPNIIDIDHDNILEFLRPWAYPSKNNETDTKRDGNFLEGPLTIPGPYPTDTMPDQIIQANRPISNTARLLYENAGCPNDTLQYSKAFILHEGSADFGQNGYDGTSPLGDPVPFSAYLIGQIACNPKFITSNFNLDADRGYGYLCWDYTRDDAAPTNVDGRDHGFRSPKTWPEGSFPAHDPAKWRADDAAPAFDPAKVGDDPLKHMHMQKDQNGKLVQADLDVSYFGRPNGCVINNEGAGTGEGNGTGTGTGAGGNGPPGPPK